MSIKSFRYIHVASLIVDEVIKCTYITTRRHLADMLGKMRFAETKYMAKNFPAVSYSHEVEVFNILHKRVVSNFITKLDPHTNFNAGQQNL